MKVWAQIEKGVSHFVGPDLSGHPAGNQFLPWFWRAPLYLTVPSA